MFDVSFRNDDRNKYYHVCTFIYLFLLFTMVSLYIIDKTKRENESFWMKFQTMRQKPIKRCLRIGKGMNIYFFPGAFLLGSSEQRPINHLDNLFWEVSHLVLHYGRRTNKSSIWMLYAGMWLKLPTFANMSDSIYISLRILCELLEYGVKFSTKLF